MYLHQMGMWCIYAHILHDICTLYSLSINFIRFYLVFLPSVFLVTFESVSDEICIRGAKVKSVPHFRHFKPGAY